jgi:hypothetical protein
MTCEPMEFFDGLRIHWKFGMIWQTSHKDMFQDFECESGVVVQRLRGNVDRQLDDSLL